MLETFVEIETPDGRCPAWVLRPEGAGPWPAAIIYMDGIGMRPALRAMAARVAGHGFYVLLPDLFYRAGAYVAPSPAALFGDTEVRKRWAATHISTASQANVRRDTGAFLEFLARQPEVRQPAVGTVGYCLGGGLALAMAGFYPDRVLAAASYHGSYLAATDRPESPHLLAPHMNPRARIYVAGADEDPSFPPDMKDRLDQALASAGLAHTVEIYLGARHGFAPPDTPTHDPVAAERHYQTLFELFDAALR
ncbi:MAG TPA: dienelactone hydrolase family protein [Polyangia bacterium]|nr:dienelactone hydrolase family protein [Polyangia bacterium]